MKIKLTLGEDFIDRIRNLRDFNNIYAAMWIIQGIKTIVDHWDGGAIWELGKFNDEYVNNCIDWFGFYKLGYVRAMMDLKQPLLYDSDLPVSQEFCERALAALKPIAFERLESESPAVLPSNI